MNIATSLRVKEHSLCGLFRAKFIVKVQPNIWNLHRTKTVEAALIEVQRRFIEDAIRDKIEGSSR